MPFIQELDQQKAALVRINRNLSEVTKVNAFIKSLNELQMNATDVKTCVEVSFERNGSLERLKCPVLLEDFNFVLITADNYKRTVVEKITKDSEQFRISLTPEEKALIEMKHNVSES